MDMPTAIDPRTDSSTTALPGWVARAVSPRGLRDCTLIVPTYRRPREIAVLLQTLAGLEDCPTEVLVADASPNKDTEQAIQTFLDSQSAGFDLIYVRCPAGLTRQRNIGIDLSSKKFVFFLDDDCHPLTKYFSAAREIFVNDRAGQIGAVGGAVLNEMDRPIPGRWRLRLKLGLVPAGSALLYQDCGTSVPRGLLRPFSGTRDANVIPGCALAFRREVLREERFSEFFYGYSQGEDLEMSLRVARRWRVVCCGDAHVLHHHSAGGRPAAFNKGRMEVRNKHFIWKRNVPRPAPLDRFRFWADPLYLVLMDCIWYGKRPWRLAPLAHAAGLLRGIFDCLTQTSDYVEPQARTEYSLALEEAR